MNEKKDFKNDQRDDGVVFRILFAIYISVDKKLDVGYNLIKLTTHSILEVLYVIQRK